MKPSIVPALLACVLLAASARADEALFLTWDDCADLGAGGHDNLALCNDNTGHSTLYCAFIMPQAADQVIGIEAVVDVQHSSSDLPDWWRMDLGGCRSGTLLANADFSADTVCIDTWAGSGSGTVAYSVAQPR